MSCRLCQAEVVAKHGSPVTEAALQDMKYAEGVVRETMRITPIINATLRVALQVGWRWISRHMWAAMNFAASVS